MMHRVNRNSLTPGHGAEVTFRANGHACTDHSDNNMLHTPRTTFRLRLCLLCWLNLLFWCVLLVGIFLNSAHVYVSVFGA